MSAVIDDIRTMIEEDATPEEYQILIDSIIDEPYVSVYDRRSADIIKGWEREADRRKAIEDQLPKIGPEVLGRLAYINFKNNVATLKREGII